MIRINLAKKMNRGGGGKALFDLKNLSFSSVLEILKGQSEGKKFDLNGPLPKLVVGLAACYFVDDMFIGFKEDELKKIEADISVIEAEKETISKKLAKIKGFEPVKKQLEADEKAIRLKLDVVNKLLEDRNAPAKMMMQIAQSIPDEVWLTSVDVTEDKVKLAGSTPNYSQVSDFLKALDVTSQFNEITLSGIEENSAQSSSVKVQNFDLTATRRRGSQ